MLFLEVSLSLTEIEQVEDPRFSSSSLFSADAFLTAVSIRRLNFPLSKRKIDLSVDPFAFIVKHRLRKAAEE